MGKVYRRKRIHSTGSVSGAIDKFSVIGTTKTFYHTVTLDNINQLTIKLDTREWQVDYVASTKTSEFINKEETYTRVNSRFSPEVATQISIKQSKADVDEEVS